MKMLTLKQIEIIQGGTTVRQWICGGSLLAAGWALVIPVVGVPVSATLLGLHFAACYGGRE